MPLFFLDSLSWETSESAYESDIGKYGIYNPDIYENIPEMVFSHQILDIEVLGEEELDMFLDLFLL